MYIFNVQFKMATIILDMTGSGQVWFDDMFDR